MMNEVFEFKTHGKNSDCWQETSSKFVCLNQVSGFETTETVTYPDRKSTGRTCLTIYVPGGEIEVWNYDESEFEAFKSRFHILKQA